MDPFYRAIVHQLFLALDLPTPNDEESVLNPQVGPRLCHPVRHLTDHPLMLTHLKGQGDATASEQNLPNQDPCKPILGCDPESSGRLFWNRRPLQPPDRTQIYHQLERLVAAAEELR